MTNRQPKGTPVGGQFAEGRKPDGGDLIQLSVNGVVVASYQHIDADVSSSSTPSLDAGNMCLFCGRSSGFVNRVPADRTSDDGSINVTGYMCAECDGCEEDATFRHCPECGTITAGNDEGVCNSCGEEQDEDTSNVPLNIPRSLCTQCTGETDFNFDVFAYGLKGDNLMTEVGNKYGVIKIAEWADQNYDDNEVLMQVLSINEASQLDSDGWSARGIAQILKERNVKSASVSDVLDIFNDSELVSVAFDPKRGINQVMMEINATLKGAS